MKVIVDLSGYTGPMKSIRERMQTLPDAVMGELTAATVTSMSYHAPRDKGFLIGSIIPHKVSPGKFWVGPTMWYSPNVLYFGKNSKKYPTTYLWRAWEGVKSNANRIVNAKASQHLKGG